MSRYVFHWMHTILGFLHRVSACAGTIEAALGECDKPTTGALDWSARGQPWRTEPEIALDRRQDIACCLHAKATPLGKTNAARRLRLSRADVEWLLATADEQNLLVDLRSTDLRDVRLEGLDLSDVRLEEAECQGVSLAHTVMRRAYLSGANLSDAHLEGACLAQAHLEGTRLCGAFCDASTDLEGVQLGSWGKKAVALADIHWGGANITTVEWTVLEELGDEARARSRQTYGEFRIALRAYRQVATVLRDLGLHEEADSFAYRAHLLKRKLLGWQVLRQARQDVTIRPLLRLGLRLRRGHLGWTVGILAGLIAPTAGLLLVQGMLPSLAVVGLAGLASFLLLCIPALFLPMLPQLLMLLTLAVLMLTVLQAVAIGILFGAFEVTLAPLIQDLLTLPFEEQLVVFGATVVAVVQIGRVVWHLLDWAQHRSRFASLVRFALATPQRFVLYEGRMLLGWERVLVGNMRYGFAFFLEGISGYGYKPERCVFWYLATLLGFALFYFLAGQPFAWDTFFLSLTSFHGRGFFPGTLPQPKDIVVALAALEAVLGLFLEISFVAAFSQRYFGK